MRLLLKKTADKSVWHRWFAWRPVTIEDSVSPYRYDHYIVWLEYVQRREVEGRV